MAIPGITDVARLPRLGKIRLGRKRKSSRGGKEYPEALDHFNFRDVPELNTLFGDGCKEIYPVVIPAEDEETWFRTARAAYSRAGLFCRCSDGETATRVNKGLNDDNEPFDRQGWTYLEQLKKKTGDVVDVGDMFDLPCPADECHYFQRKMCKNLGRLFIVVVDSPRYGTYEITTTSWNSMVNVLSSARAIKQAAGRITGIPLALKLVPMVVQPAGKTKTVYVLELEFRDGGIRQLIAAGNAPATKLLGVPDPEPDPTPDDLMPNAGGDLSQALGEDDRNPSRKEPQTVDVEATTAGDEPLNPPETIFEDDDKPSDDERNAARRDSTRKAAQRAAAKQNGTTEDPAAANTDDEPLLDF